MDPFPFLQTQNQVLDLLERGWGDEARDGRNLRLRGEVVGRGESDKEGFGAEDLQGFTRDLLVQEENGWGAERWVHASAHEAVEGGGGVGGGGAVGVDLVADFAW